MATLKELRDERLRKLEELKKLGINPYPARADRTHKLAQIVADFDSLEGEQVNVVGRVQAIRKFGKIAFIVIRDQSGELQLFLGGGNVTGLDAASGRLGMDQLSLLDAGDFVGARGPGRKDANRRNLGGST